MRSNGAAGAISLPPLACREDAEYTLLSWSGHLDYAQESVLLEAADSSFALRRGLAPWDGGLRGVERMVFMELLTNARDHAYRDIFPPQASVEARLYRNDTFELSVSNYIASSIEGELHSYLSYNRQLSYDRRKALIRERMCSMDYDSHSGAGLGLLGTFDWAEVCWWFLPYDELFTVFTIRMRVSGGRINRLKMRTLNIDQTRYSPLVTFDANARVLTLRGVSRPQNTVDFFRPVMAWIDDFVQEEQGRGIAIEPFKLVFDLDYFNSITSKYIMGIILKTKQLFPSNEGFSVVWYYTPDDEENRGVGEDMSYIAGVGFELLARSTD